MILYNKTIIKNIKKTIINLSFSEPIINKENTFIIILSNSVPFNRIRRVAAMITTSLENVNKMNNNG
jgi:hypothetical protein